MPRISIYPHSLSVLCCPPPGIPPTPILHPPAPAGSPTQQGANTQFKALGQRGPDSEFRKTVLTLETLREKAPTGILCTDEDILEWARQFAATWVSFRVFLIAATSSLAFHTPDQL